MNEIIACSACGELKHISEFPIRADTKKIRKQCKVCWQKKALAASERYNDTHKEKVSKYYANRRLNFKELFQKKYRDWQQKNKDKRAISQRNRQAKKRESGGTLSATDWKAILDKYENKCLKCGSKENITIDHVVPIALGGRNDTSNVQPLCKTCNCRKGKRIEDYRV